MIRNDAQFMTVNQLLFVVTLFQFTKDSLVCDAVLHGKVNIAVTNICDNEVLWNKSWFMFSILYLIFEKI